MINLYRHDGTMRLPDIFLPFQRSATVLTGFLPLDCRSHEVVGYANRSCMKQGAFCTGLVGPLVLEDMTCASDGVMVCRAITFLVADFVRRASHWSLRYMICFEYRLDVVTWCGIEAAETDLSTGDVESRRKQWRLFYYDLTRLNVWNVPLKPL
ncbi:hypothetical protein DYB28_003393 [Aphanomyces astaci]|uniref:Uncharacterized protein n=1 Tax=Aphanomyces astaci TaxID=112090 RepID=A0A9X8HD76_APHAT|nr:hypothetical protein DYB28_003393 [Aphanomyces astaci]